LRMSSKGRIVFVGLGLWDERDLSLRAREMVREADEVVAEFYTSRLMGTDPERLAASLGRSFTVLSREEVESGQEGLLDRADGRTLVFMTGGDALTATTHQELRRGALERGYRVDVVHAASIKTAVPGLLGLSDYRFSRTTTLVTPSPSFFPESPLDVILANRSVGLHTLVLLDIDAERGHFMTASEGAAVLAETLRRREARDEAVDPDLLGLDTPVCVVARAGSSRPHLAGGPLREVAQGDFGPPLHCLVVPGRLSDEEALMVSRVTGHAFPEG
jgi:diphthine synthase